MPTAGTKHLHKRTREICEREKMRFQADVSAKFLLRGWFCPFP